MCFHVFPCVSMYFHVFPSHRKTPYRYPEEQQKRGQDEPEPNILPYGRGLLMNHVFWLYAISRKNYIYLIRRAGALISNYSPRRPKFRAASVGHSLWRRPRRGSTYFKIEALVIAMDLPYALYRGKKDAIAFFFNTRDCFSDCGTLSGWSICAGRIITAPLFGIPDHRVLLTLLRPALC